MANKTKPATVTITMGTLLTQTKFKGKVSGENMMNGITLFMKDCQEMTGMQYKEMFAIIDKALDAKVFAKNPTMNASVSDEESGDE